MSELELMQRISALESEVKNLKAQKHENMKRIAVDHLYDKYPTMDDSYELFLDSACQHVQILDVDNQDDVNTKVENELIALCKKHGKEEPSQSIAAKNWIENYHKNEEENRKHAETLKKTFV